MEFIKSLLLVLSINLILTFAANARSDRGYYFHVTGDYNKFNVSKCKARKNLDNLIVPFQRSMASMKRARCKQSLNGTEFISLCQNRYDVHSIYVVYLGINKTSKMLCNRARANYIKSERRKRVARERRIKAYRKSYKKAIEKARRENKIREAKKAAKKKAELDAFEKALQKKKQERLNKAMRKPAMVI